MGTDVCEVLGQHAAGRPACGGQWRDADTLPTGFGTNRICLGAGCMSASKGESGHSADSLSLSNRSGDRRLECWITLLRWR